MTKRILSVFVAVMMVLAVVPVLGLAEAARSGPITAVEIEGYVAPEWGEQPVYDVTVPEDAHYSVDDMGWFMYSAAFFDEMQPGESFDDPSMSYYFGVLLAPEEGWYFPEDAVDVLINGSEEYFDYSFVTEDGYLAVYTVSCTVWDPSGEPIAIHEVSVYGFDVPPMIGWYSGDHLDLFVPAGAPYQIDLPNACWWDDDAGYEFEGVFEAGVNYSCGVTVFVNGNYYFADDCEFIINGGAVPIDPEYTEIDAEDNSTAYIWSLPMQAVPQGELIPIHEIYVNGFEDPIAGELVTDHSSLTVPDDANYSTFERTSWWNETTDEAVTDPGYSFEAGCEYSEGVSVVANSGYYFASDCTIYGDGDPDVIDQTFSYVDPSDNTKAYVWGVPRLCEEEPGLIPIHEVIVNGWGAPVEGMAGIDNVYLETPSDAPYFIIYGGWRDETDQQQMWSDEHIFVAGHEYSEGCQIWAEEGYYFAEDCVFLTDDDVELDLQWCYVDEYENYICYMNTVPVVCEGEAPGHLWGDADGDGDVDSADTLLVMRAVMNLTQLDPENAPWCDVNGDGVLDMSDALLISRFTMGFIPTLPA